MLFLLLSFLLNKILILKNKIIKYNQVHDLYFKIRYLHPHLSLNFLLYSLVNYHIFFT
jgi:hypothetical protein